MNEIIDNFLNSLEHGSITDDSECIICKEIFQKYTYDYVKLDCSPTCSNSIYHKKCLKTWILLDPQMNTKCCYCQQKIDMLKYLYNSYYFIIKLHFIASIHFIITDVIIIEYLNSKLDNLLLIIYFIYLLGLLSFNSLFSFEVFRSIMDITKNEDYVHTLYKTQLIIQTFHIINCFINFYFFPKIYLVNETCACLIIFFILFDFLKNKIMISKDIMNLKCLCFILVVFVMCFLNIAKNKK